MRITAVTLQLRRLLLGTTALTGLALAAHPAAAAGLPTGGVVTVGTASIAQTTANNLAVTTGGPRTVIDWQSFSIAGGNKVTIQQPGKSSITVNEVTGGTASQIFGSLSSNGQVVLANPNGIWFGPDSHVDVAGLVASTATMTDQSKKAFGAGGRLALDNAGSSTASIVNDGHITIASAGLGALVAPGVRNNGVIQATLGTVTLAAGTTSTLDFYGDGLVSLAVTSPVTALAIGPDGKPFKAAIENNGTLAANGGHVLVTADVVKGVVDNVINMSGVTEAKGVTVAGGDIVLDGGDGGVMVAGTLDASGTKAGQAGGSIAVTGGSVTLASTATVDASGATGGGKVQIGGGPHGGGTVKHAQTTTVVAGASIKADATQNGTGGTVSVWSDVATRFDGSISAKGAGTGNGGWVETSSKGSLGVGPTANVDTSAPGGLAGSWLLDPYDITVDATGTSGNVSYNAGTDSNTSDTSSILQIDAGTISSASGNVTLYASHDLTVNGAINNSAATSLTLIGENQVLISNSITLNGSFLSTVGKHGTFTLVSGSTISAGGAIEIAQDSSTLYPGPATQGSTINIGGSLVGAGVYLKSAYQTHGEAGTINVAGSIQDTSAGTLTGTTQAGVILYAGEGGTIQLQSGMSVSSQNGNNIALVADALTIADSPSVDGIPANISTTGKVILSPAANVGGSLSAGSGYTDPLLGGTSVLNGSQSPTAIDIYVGTTGSGYLVPQATLDSLGGSSPTNTVGALQIGLPGAGATVNIDSAGSRVGRPSLVVLPISPTPTRLAAASASTRVASSILPARPALLVT